MIHKTRRYSIAAVATLEELAEKLAEYSWTLCTGFLSEGLLVVNDAFSPDGAQEFAVFRCPFSLEELRAESTPELDQIESLTCSWMKPAEIAENLAALAGKAPAPELPRGPVVVATTLAHLAEALSDEEHPPRRPKPFARHKIKTHGREYCQLCA